MKGSLVFVSATGGTYENDSISKTLCEYLFEISRFPITEPDRNAAGLVEVGARNLHKKQRVIIVFKAAVGR